jgi:excisionase family DNA binding protein
VTDKESQESPEGSNREDLTNFLTVREAADRLGVDPHDLAAKVVNGTIPSTRHAGRVLISRAEVEKRRG